MAQGMVMFKRATFFEQDSCILYPGQPLPVVDSPPQTQSRTLNVILFGETGVGKSSVINLIARNDIAQVSSDVNGCTMQSKRYDIPFDGIEFAIFDTIGLEEPQMGVNGYLKAIAEAYELVSKLGAAGGIHLLLFCLRGGRITATTQSNYRLFCECLCDTKVPIALVFTGLEREEVMENWWMRNRKHIEDYGIKSDGHACITAVQDDTPGDHKYEQSQEIIRELLKKCARKTEAYSPESLPWFLRLALGMKGFIAGKKRPKGKDYMKVLTQRCKLDEGTARRIADMMKRDETEKNENTNSPAEKREDGGGKETGALKNLTDEADAGKSVKKDPQAENGEDEGGEEIDALKKDDTKGTNKKPQETNGEGEGGEATDPAKDPTNGGETEKSTSKDTQEGNEEDEDWEEINPARNSTNEGDMEKNANKDLQARNEEDRSWAETDTTKKRANEGDVEKSVNRGAQARIHGESEEGKKSGPGTKERNNVESMRGREEEGVVMDRKVTEDVSPKPPSKAADKKTVGDIQSNAPSDVVAPPRVEKERNDAVPLAKKVSHRNLADGASPNAPSKVKVSAPNVAKDNDAGHPTKKEKRVKPRTRTMPGGFPIAHADNDLDSPSP